MHCRRTKPIIELETVTLIHLVTGAISKTRVLFTKRSARSWCLLRTHHYPDCSKSTSSCSGSNILRMGDPFHQQVQH
jgi:hypothetical protein